jgi:cytochrome c oxidase subunit 3
MMQRDHALRVAVWIVLASEALLFAGLFALYAAYRSEFPRAFSEGVALGVAWIGATNTLPLLTSSFAIAWAVHATRAGRVVDKHLAIVLALGTGFLVLKAIEWTIHARDGIVPGLAYAGPSHASGASLFATLYYAMTGLHAAHVIAGLALVSWVLVLVRRRLQNAERHLALELVAVYWHFVDVVWVFLWPLFYLLT